MNLKINQEHNNSNFDSLVKENSLNSIKNLFVTPRTAGFMKQILSYLFVVIFYSCNSSNQNQDRSDDVPFTKAMACTFSEIVYSNTPDSLLKQYLPGWKIAWNPEAVNGNYAFAATNNNKIVIAIRGSVLQFDKAAFDNWIRQDFNIAEQKEWVFTDSTSDAKISQGSYEAWENIQILKDKKTGHSLWQFLDSTLISNSSLLITGHSLGGNLSTVYGSWLAYQLKKQNKSIKKIQVITFAAPAAGNEVFAKDFNTKFPEAMLIENTNDIVPKFPVANAVGNLGELFKPKPDASEIEIAKIIISINLATVFDGLKLTLQGMEVYNGNSVYTQPKVEKITIKLSGLHNENTVEDFFSEAGYQHGVKQYAVAVGAPIFKNP